MGYTYFGETAGGRVIRYGVGVTQVGDGYQLEVRSWDVRPAGESGRVVFRKITGLLRHTAGYDIEVTPVLDGRPLPSNRFNGGPPPAGLLEAVIGFEVPVFGPGNRLDAILESVTLAAGELELVDLQVVYAPVRTSQ